MAFGTDRMKENRIYNMDCLDGMLGIDDNSIDLIVTDPPYGISFMGKDWDKALPSIDIWKKCLRILKPGAFAFIMCIPRQDCLGRMISNLSDAGFRTDFTSIYWTYASGFPKAHNIGKAIDKKLGVEREVIGMDRQGKKSDGVMAGHHGWTEGEVPITKGNSELEGSYAGFQPKPAVEVIIVAMKPLSERNYTEQALSNRKGITWLDDCRIPFASNKDENEWDFNRRGPAERLKQEWKAPYEGGWNKPDIPKAGKRTASFFEKDTISGGDGSGGFKAHNKGRFPANLLVSDSILDNGKEHKSSPLNCMAKNEGGVCYGKYNPHPAYNPGDKGGYSRFFSLDAWANNLPFLIVPKASKSEKNKGLDNIDAKSIKGRDSGQDIRNVPYKQRTTPVKNQHPTVKPIKLMAYLITLGSREGDLILDPFIGSGTTMIAAKQLNRKYIGFEISKEYYDIALRRLE